MQYKNLGKSGLVVSRVSFGDPTKGRHSWILNEEQSRPIIRQAVETGINFFDTANMYEAGTSEEVLDRALKHFAEREEMVVASKVFMPVREDVNGRGRTWRLVLQQKIPTKLEQIVTTPSLPACMTCRKSQAERKENSYEQQTYNTRPRFQC
jgi:aryl-alcohol dehydrogenase-like predicted oxidoreductase